MNPEFNTLELARLYERQGHFQEALGIYQALDRQDQDPEIEACILGMKNALDSQTILESPLNSRPEKKIQRLLEQWLNLMVLQKRLFTLRISFKSASPRRSISF